MPVRIGMARSASICMTAFSAATLISSSSLQSSELPLLLLLLAVVLTALLLELLEPTPALAALVAVGLAERDPVAHDICRPSHPRAGGGRGYSHIFDDFLPRLERHGVDRKTSMMFMDENPVRWLTGG